MDLNGRVAVITGATGDLGRVAARRLLVTGASLVLVGTSRRRLDELAATLPEAEARVTTVEADLTTDAGGEVLAAALDSGPGRADLLLHVVGGWSGGQSLLEVPLDTLRDLLARHVWTTTHAIRATVPRMLANGWGRVIAISTPMATRPGPGQAAYAAAKAAQEALVLGLARDVAGSGVTANVLQVREIKSETPELRRSWTTPDEIVGAVLYLASDAAGVVSGARIPVLSGPL
ncbi:MAG TPA: SDR family oxidoreductase [candidate division Zixibacteria bacterium]|nr:SDR family oxidoreductase [candidate division Zixibacteria bacterium]